MQLFVLAICIFMLACIGAFYPYNRGALYTALIVLYAATAGISGYIAASLYRQMEGKSWVRNILLTCFIYCGPFFLMFCFANTIAIVYRVRPTSEVPPSFLSLFHPLFLSFSSWTRRILALASFRHGLETLLSLASCIGFPRSAIPPLK